MRHGAHPDGVCDLKKNIDSLNFYGHRALKNLAEAGRLPPPVRRHLPAVSLSGNGGEPGMRLLCVYLTKF